MNRINIMTSCDDKIATLILPQIASIGVNLADYDVHFYLFHYRISEKNVNDIKKYIKKFTNITFHEVIMENLDVFESLASNGGRFPAEAYVYLYCHPQLPTEIDRIMYIDAGDVIIHGDISEYYFSDFENNAFIVSLEIFASVGEDNKPRLLNKADLNDPGQVNMIRQNYVNSGCIVINLEKLRENKMNFNETYLKWAEKLKNMNLPLIQDDPNVIYLGDQGILGVAFMDDMKCFGLDEVINNTLHTFPMYNTDGERHLCNVYKPYNFTQWIYKEDISTNYTPIIIHYATPFPKPWNYKFTEGDIKNPDRLSGRKEIENMSPLKNNRQLELHKVWWDYYNMTISGKEVEKRDKSITKLNPLWFMAEYHLKFNNYTLAKECIDKIKAIENEFKDNTSACVYGSLLNRHQTGNKLDPFRTKAHTLLNKKNYADAITPYEECFKILDNHIEETCTAPLVFLNKFSVGKNENKEFYAECIAQCNYNLKNYEQMFFWLNHVPLKNANDVNVYFHFMNECGMFNHVKNLFNRVAKTKNHEIMDECIVAFNDIVLPNPQAENILASFFDDYINLMFEYAVRNKDGQLNNTVKMAYHLHLSDNFAVKGDYHNAMVQIKSAITEDSRFLSLIKGRIDAFSVT